MCKKIAKQAINKKNNNEIENRNELNYENGNKVSKTNRQSDGNAAVQFNPNYNRNNSSDKRRYADESKIYLFFCPIKRHKTINHPYA